MSPGEALARLRLTRTEGIGPNGFQRLIARHGVQGLSVAPPG
jgi:hypothetical protein